MIIYCKLLIPDLPIFFLVKGVKGPSLYLTECMSKMTTLCDNVTNVYAKCRMYCNEKKNP